MSITVTFYNNSADVRVVDKTASLTQLKQKTCYPVSGCNILNPSIKIDYDSDVMGANYMIIGAPFNRAYFITDMAMDVGQSMTVAGSVDVLHTYSAQIKASTAQVVRSESTKTTMQVDSELPIDPKRYSIEGIRINNTILNPLFGTFVLGVYS